MNGWELSCDMYERDFLLLDEQKASTVLTIFNDTADGQESCSVKLSKEKTLELIARLQNMAAHL